MPDGSVRRASVSWSFATFAAVGKPLRAALCGLLALAQILAFAHLATVGHRTCLEHGEAIHAGARPPGAVRVDASVRRVAANSSSSDLEEHQHEHCLFAAHGRSKLVLPVPATMGLIDVGPVGARAVATTPLVFAGVDVLALAPKGSPPVG
jgi:hypothetical protein